MRIAARSAPEGHLQAQTAGAPVPEPVPAAGGGKTLWWAVGAAVVLALVYFLSR